MSVSRSRRLMAHAVRLFCCAMLAATFCLVAGETCQAQIFSRWNSRGVTSRVATPYRSVTPKYRTVEPVTGYGSNFHRNFTIRQQQLRVQAGKPVQRRHNVLLYGVR